LLTRDVSGLPVPYIIHDGLVQVLLAGGAALVNEGEALALERKLTEVMELEKHEGDVVTINKHITLKRGSQTPFDTPIFGRAVSVDLGGMARVTRDRFVNLLIFDDYFLIHLL